MRHIEMKTVSIRDLHARTGEIVREAAKRPLQVTDRGRVIAVIQAPGVAAKGGVPLPNREAWIAKLPKQKTDSAELIGADRDR
jgi:antitoxin (DNA-binding transcriptional repressor) of toxin-antitoxin stability system